MPRFRRIHVLFREFLFSIAAKPQPAAGFKAVEFPVPYDYPIPIRRRD